VPNVACFSGLSILDCPFCLFQKPIQYLQTEVKKVTNAHTH
jgi:hypothetical protein